MSKFTQFEFECGEVIVRIGDKTKWLVEALTDDGYHLCEVCASGLNIRMNYEELDDCHDNYVRVGKWDMNGNLEVGDAE